MSIFEGTICKCTQLFCDIHQRQKRIYNKIHQLSFYGMLLTWGGIWRMRWQFRTSVFWYIGVIHGQFPRGSGYDENWYWHHGCFYCGLSKMRQYIWNMHVLLFKMFPTISICKRIPTVWHSVLITWCGNSTPRLVFHVPLLSSILIAATEWRFYF